MQILVHRFPKHLFFTEKTRAKVIQSAKNMPLHMLHKTSYVQPVWLPLKDVPVVGNQVV